MTCQLSLFGLKSYTFVRVWVPEDDRACKMVHWLPYPFLLPYPGNDNRPQ